MKLKNILCPAIALIALSATSCNDYLDIKPKGEKIPQTLADYEALLRGENMLNPMTSLPTSQALYLLNDMQRNTAMLNTHNLTWANYMWQEDADRIELNGGDEPFFYYAYNGIASCNLILDGAPTAVQCTEQERNEVMAYARTIRAYNYFMLLNYYADTYTEADAATKRGVPIILSPEPNAPYNQPSVAECYDFIINEIKTCLENDWLPVQAMTIIHPSRGAAYAMLARIYLTMCRYDDALTYADKALAENNALYDWNTFYDANKTNIESTRYTLMASPMSYDYCENYFFRNGEQMSPGVALAEPNMNYERGTRFEEGDAKFKSRWKLQSTSMDTYFKATTRGYVNLAGLTTTEIYLIKAECLARKGMTGDALEIVNTIRRTRIRPDSYIDKTASNTAEAIGIIRNLKDNELVMTLVPFMDARRFNSEGIYTRTMTKTVGNETYTLSPDSHLWTMTFPGNAIENMGNGTIVQNSK